MFGITIADLLPALVALAAALGLLWFAAWLLTRALQHAADSRGQFERSAKGAGHATIYLRRATSLASLVIALLIMLYGVGIRGVPQWSWSDITAWVWGSGLPLLFILGSAIVLIQTAGMVASKLPSLLVPGHLPIAERMDRRKRVETRGRMARWTVTVLVLGIAGVMSLKTVGVDVTPLLAGGAIISVALGFGAQDLVRDIIGGFSMMLEDHLRVGDIVEINGRSGQVEAVHLRTTVLRAIDGAVHVIQNGTIKELSNMTKHYAYALLDIGVAYKEDVDRVMGVLRDIGAELREDATFAPKILAPMEVMGVQEFAASAVVIRIRMMSVPIDQWDVARELRRRIKNRFDAEGISLPFPHLSMYLHEGGLPLEGGLQKPDSGA